MRRVIDDAMYNDVAKQIMDIVMGIPASKVSQYDCGMYRSQEDKIRDYILDRVSSVKFGKSMNTTMFGNNACYEIIYTGNPIEEQVCGTIHLTDDMYGGTIVWCSNYDNNCPTHGKRTIKGCVPKIKKRGD